MIWESFLVWESSPHIARTQAVHGEAVLIIGTPAAAIQLTQKEPTHGT